MRLRYFLLCLQAVFGAALLVGSVPVFGAGSDGVAVVVDIPTTGIARSNPAVSQLRLEFHAANLDRILDYFSEAGGCIINKEDAPSGSFDLQSDGPISRQEAVQLLNSMLKKKGYTVIAKGRILTIRRLDSAKAADLEVVVGNNPEAVERSDEIVTQIIPVRFASASQLINNLQTLLPPSASLSANESANSLIMVATKTDIRRMLKIISSLDNSIARVSSIKVLALRYADAKQLAAVIQQLFASTQSSQTSGGFPQAGPMFMMQGGPGSSDPPGGGPGAINQQQGGSQSDGSGTKNSKVVAAADDISNSLIVSAPADYVSVITNVVNQLDRPASDITEMRVFHLQHADPTEVAEQLASLFPDSSSSSGGSDSRIQFAGGPPGMGFGGRSFGPQGGSGSGSDSSTRSRKRGQVIAVADPRSSSLIVSADSSLLPQIAQMLHQLDSNPARKEVVRVFELQNSSATEVSQVLQSLFQRNITARNSTANSSLENSDALLTRQTQQQNTSGLGNFGSGSGFGSSGQSSSP